MLNNEKNDIVTKKIKRMKNQNFLSLFVPSDASKKSENLIFIKNLEPKIDFRKKVAICLSFFIILFCNFTAQTFLIYHLLKYLSAKLFFLDGRNFIQLLLSVILPNYILYLNTCFVHVFSKIYLLLFICNIYRVFIDLFSNFFPELLPV
jgi:hypothetical protein